MHSVLFHDSLSSFFLYLCSLKKTATALSPASLVGGKSGQLEPPYFLTGRDRDPKGHGHSKCRRKQTAAPMDGKGENAR